MYRFVFDGVREHGMELQLQEVILRGTDGKQIKAVEATNPGRV
jgi:hypothetical protein